ncbi:MAG: glycoside hydrolase family 65 [Acidobacteriota bacterium]
MKNKELSRRRFIKSLTASATVIHLEKDNFLAEPVRGETINRFALVNRHQPSIRKLDPLSPLSLGNGEFAFTADITGLQSFPEAYEKTMPLCMMAQWGWHTTPLPSDIEAKVLQLTEYEIPGRKVGYATRSEGQQKLYNWLRENPHRLHLGQIGFQFKSANGKDTRVSELTNIEQRLDLWAGNLTSHFQFEDKPVEVKTAVHPQMNLLAVAIDSPLFLENRLAIRMAFPYGSPDMQAADWSATDRHQTTIIRQTRDGISLHRQLNRDEYFANLNWKGAATFAQIQAHTFLLTPQKSSTIFSFVIAFSPKRITQPLPTTAATFSASAKHWQIFWSRGGAIELAESRDSRAIELERRVVLSQYLTAIQCSGSQPPQETGLTVNSWYGKFHLEMHWWHAAHFALWNRLPLLEKSLAWYEKILPAAQKLARSQGYAGARWPKMVGPEGRDSPSPIGPLLIWQQPHPIFYAELCYVAKGGRNTLERYRKMVFESAEFMASFAFFDVKKQGYVLGPPVIPAQENHPPRETWNPTFELAYWNYGLKTAQRWRERLGMKRHPLWDAVIDKLSPLPIQNGLYLAHENCPQTFTERHHDHPSMLGALGILNGDKVDRETMRRTLHQVMKHWQWDKTWGWDYPMTAMTAARLGEPEIAIEALLMNTEKNGYLPNGHNYQRPNLPCYLPGNGGLLYAVAMMAGGWQGAPHTQAPGFPTGGSWTVRRENLNARLLKVI